MRCADEKLLVCLARRNPRWRTPTWRGRLVAYFRASGLVQLPCLIDGCWWTLEDVGMSRWCG